MTASLYLADTAPVVGRVGGNWLVFQVSSHASSSLFEQYSPPGHSSLSVHVCSVILFYMYVFCFPLYISYVGSYAGIIARSSSTSCGFLPIHQDTRIQTPYVLQRRKICRTCLNTFPRNLSYFVKKTIFSRTTKDKKIIRFLATCAYRKHSPPHQWTGINVVQQTSSMRTCISSVHTHLLVSKNNFSESCLFCGS